MRISDWSSDVCSSDLGTKQRPPVILRCALLWAQRRRQPRCGLRRFGHGLRDRLPRLRITLPDQRARLDEARPDSRIEPVPARELGRASCRERVCKYVLIPVVAVTLQKKKT